VCTIWRSVSRSKVVPPFCATAARVPVHGTAAVPRPDAGEPSPTATGRTPDQACDH
jgi:hypothetical protein